MIDRMTKQTLLAVVLLLWSFGANTQLFNPIATQPFSGVYDNSGAPWPFFNQVAAVNYNYGGQGFGYNVPSPNCVGNTCVAGASGYRADAVNFKSSTFGSGFNWQLGFSASPNSWNYTISITQPGPYIITLWVGSTSTGGSWNVYIDKTLVGNVVTPNTGSYSTLSASSSPSFNATQGTHILTLAWASGDGAGGSGDLVAWQGAKAGAGIACAIGPTYTGTIPAAAQAAGLTTCFMNLDFTNASLSNPNTWIDCLGASNPLMYISNGPGVSNLVCGSYSIGTDPASGETALIQTFPSPSSSQQSIGTSPPTTSANVLPSLGVTVPHEWYTEVRLRQGNANTFTDWWFSVSMCCSAASFEFDVGESDEGANTWLGGSTGEVATPSNCSSSNNCHRFTVDPQQMHTIGERATFDAAAGGNANYALCFYDDNGGYPHQVVCNQGSLGSNNYGVREIPLLNNSSYSGAGGPYTTYWRYITIWTCANWPANGVVLSATNCDNGRVTSNP
jgi:hypothetical protein